MTVLYPPPISRLLDINPFFAFLTPHDRLRGKNRILKDVTKVVIRKFIISSTILFLKKFLIFFLEDLAIKVITNFC